MAQKVYVAARMYGVDDETWGSNEFGRAFQHREAIVNETMPQDILDMDMRWGGECRVELDLNAHLQGTGDVVVSGKMALFEGTSEEDTDKDGEEDINFLLPNGNYAIKHYTVRNEDEGGDYATVSMTLSNMAA